VIQKIFISKGYAWYLLSIFFSMFVDSLFQTTVLVFLTYRTEQWTLWHPAFLVQMVVASSIICPLFFSGLAGQWGDKFNKKHFFVVQKVAEFFTAIVCFFVLINYSLWGVMVGILMFGLLTTLGGPVRMSMIPQILPQNQLIRGNSLFILANLAAFMLGAGLGAYLVIFDNYTLTIGLVLMGCTTLGLVASFFLPPARSFNTHLNIDWNILNSTKKMLLYPFLHKHFFIVIFLIGWFWFISTILKTQSPLIGHKLGGSETVVGLFFVAFILGSAVGAALCNVFTKTLRLWICAVGALLIALAGLDAWYVASSMAVVAPNTWGWWPFLQNLSGLRISFDIFTLGVGLGVWFIPLNVFLQVATPHHERSQALAASSVWSALLIAGAAGFATGLSALGFDVYETLLAVMVVHILICVGFFFCLPGSAPLFFKGRPLKEEGDVG
jgi:predicted MFS family arabinose efflux permease